MPETQPPQEHSLDAALDIYITEVNSASWVKGMFEEVRAKPSWKTISPLVLFSSILVATFIFAPPLWAMFTLGGSVLFGIGPTIYSAAAKKDRAKAKDSVVDELLSLSKCRANKKGPVNRYTILREARGALYDRDALARAPSQQVVILKAARERFRSRGGRS